MFSILKMIFVDADGLFFGMFKETNQEILHITVHAVSGVKHKDVIN